MDLTSLADAPAYDPDTLVARPFLDGAKMNARIIRLSPGQDLPPHTHGESELMIYAVEGEGTLSTDDGPVPFPAGSLVVLRGDEELRMSNAGDTGLTMLAFLSPSFPPPSAT